MKFFINSHIRMKMEEQMLKEFLNTLEIITGKNYIITLQEQGNSNFIKLGEENDYKLKVEIFEKRNKYPFDTSLQIEVDTEPELKDLNGLYKNYKDIQTEIQKIKLKYSTVDADASLLSYCKEHTTEGWKWRMVCGKCGSSNYANLSEKLPKYCKGILNNDCCPSKYLLAPDLEDIYIDANYNSIFLYGGIGVEVPIAIGKITNIAKFPSNFLDLTLNEIIEKTCIGC